MINKMPAARSPYLEAFLALGFKPDFTALILRGKYYEQALLSVLFPVSRQELPDPQDML
jgi:hypothetical protein